MSTIGIRVRFVADTFAATDASGRAEWPPHPARLLYAAVDAAGADVTEPEKRALRWLAKQSAPSISCPKPFVRTGEPKPYMPYVPERLNGLTPRTNDRPFPEVVLPDGREDIVFGFDKHWPEVLVADLDRLLARVRRLGTHRSPCVVDLVRPVPRPAWVRKPSHVPDDHPEVRWLRWGYEGIVDDLRQEWQKRCGRGRRQADFAREPMKASQVAYVPAKRAREPQRREGAIETFRLAGDRFYARDAVHVVTAVRVALNETTGGALASVHGHAPDGRPAKNEQRVGVIPLIDAGYEWSDGRIIGVGFVIPPALEYDDDLLRGLGVLHRRPIRVPGRSAARLATLEERDDTWALNPERWTRPSRRWATVTPIVNDGFPGGSGSRLRPSGSGKVAKKVGKMLMQAAPTASGFEIKMSRRPLMRGLSPSWEFTAPEHRRWSWRMHLQVVFDEPVAGPLLVGPGRWQGWGLLAPVPNRE